jgi:predicted metal-dependent hydrolase
MSQQALHNAKEMVAREKLEFGIDDSAPRWWYENNPYKSRLIDAIQAAFPDGERYFISSVRPFRDQITDPELKEEVKTFIRQEGQHGIVHSRYNQLLRDRGLDVDAITSFIKWIDTFHTRHFSEEYNLALTCAFEHFTAMLAETFFEKKETMAGADPKFRAMMAWHAVEEMEHKAVAFDVMQKVAKVGYVKRNVAMVHVILFLTYLSLRFTNTLLKGDGFSWGQRLWMTAKCQWWLYGPKGIVSSRFGTLFSYFKPGFHPWQQAAIHNYDAWLQTYERTGDPIEAGDALFRAAH